MSLQLIEPSLPPVSTKLSSPIAPREAKFECKYCEKIISSPKTVHITKCPQYTPTVYQLVAKILQSHKQPELLLAEITRAQSIVLQKIQQDQQEQLRQERINRIQCAVCGQIHSKRYPMTYISLFECEHIYCTDCFKKHSSQSYADNRANPVCAKCFRPISLDLIKLNFDEQEFQELQKILRMILIDSSSLVGCCKCKQVYDLTEGRLEEMPKAVSASTISNQTYVKNRFVCRNQKCKADQCRSCQISPYHNGYSCEEWKEYISMKKCRFCNGKIVVQKSQANQIKISSINHCQNEQCKDRAQKACKKINQCGHQCYGVHRQTECCPCLHPDCAKSNISLRSQDADEFCHICYSEGLGAAPVLVSKCGHIFHLHCLKRRLETKWLSALISFDFCMCVLCKQWLEFPAEEPLQQILYAMACMRDKVSAMALMRLQSQQLLNDPRLTDPKSSYYKQPQNYASAIYAYFQCFKCSHPYFGGRRNCMEERQPDRQDQAFKKEDMLCSVCSAVVIEDCPKHKKQFISFKCKFCCSIASWFCWGNTHFCEPCHQRQLAGEKVNLLPPKECEGAEKCPLKGRHPPNGTEFSLGCSLCDRSLILPQS